MWVSVPVGGARFVGEFRVEFIVRCASSGVELDTGEIMANGTDRVHRMTGEAFQRLRNDHEQFLEAYESE